MTLRRFRSAAPRLADAFALLTALVSRAADAEPSLFDDRTASAFPAPACADADAGDLGCYTSYMLALDADGDRHLDVLFANGGGYYEPGNAEPTVLYLGQGTRSLVDAQPPKLPQIRSRLRQVAAGDIDADGDVDLYLPGGYGVDADRLLIQIDGAFVDDTAARLGLLRSRAGATRFGDVDGDGDLDLVVTDWGLAPLESRANLHLYLNDGSAHFTAAPKTALPPPRPASFGNTPVDVDFVDLDGDFALDIVVNHRNGRSRLLRNDGSGTFSESSDNLPEKQGPYSYNLEPCDVDGDGDLDLLADNAAAALPDHASQLLINDGKGKFADETVRRIVSESQSDDNQVKCADVNGDGNYDLIVASLTGPAEKLLLNDGKGNFVERHGAFPQTVDPTLGVDVGDFDEDGQLDVVTGQGEGMPRLDRIYFGHEQAPDTTPPRLLIDTTAQLPGLLRVAVRDRYTNDAGQTVKEVWLELDEQPVPGAVVRFMGGDLFQASFGAVMPGHSVRFGARDFAGNVGYSAAAEPLSEAGGGGGGGEPPSPPGGKAGAPPDESGGAAGESAAGQTGNAAGALPPSPTQGRGNDSCAMGAPRHGDFGCAVLVGLLFLGGRRRHRCRRIPGT